MKKLTIFLLIATLMFSVLLASCDGASVEGGSESTEDAKPESPIEGCTGVEFMLNQDGTCYSLARIGKCTATDIVVPSTYNNLPVVAIGNYVFRNCAALKSVVIPDSVQSIGLNAFENCTALESVVMEGVVSIDLGTFSGCTSLKSVSISDDIEYVSFRAFDGCTSLNYTVSEGGKYLGNTENPYAVLVAVEDANVTSFKVNSGAKVLINRLFSDYTQLTSVEIPASVKTIGANAFEGCRNLESVKIEEGSQMKWIWEYAFRDCEKLSEMTIPSGTLYVGDESFSSCKNLGSLVIPASVEYVGHYAFSGTMTFGEDTTNYLKIYCEAESLPDGWDSQWNGYYDNDCEVVWGSTGN